MKIFTIFLTFFSAFSLFFTLSVSAQHIEARTGCRVSIEWWAQTHQTIMNNLQGCAHGGNGVSIEGTGSLNHEDDFRQKVMSFSSGFLRYAALFAVAAIVIAGIIYVTAYGDGEKLKKAKETAIYACVGLLLALVSYSLVNAILAIIYGSV